MIKEPDQEPKPDQEPVATQKINDMLRIEGGLLAGTLVRDSGCESFAGIKHIQMVVSGGYAQNSRKSTTETRLAGHYEVQDAAGEPKLVWREKGR